MGQAGQAERSRRGGVSVSPRGRFLRHRWHWGGERFEVSLGYPDTDLGRSLANDVARQIERDILLGQFDPSRLDDYRFEVESRINLTCAEVMGKFIEALGDTVSLQALDSWRSAAAWLGRCSLDNLPVAHLNRDRAKAVATRIARERQPATVKKYLLVLAQAWDWARAEGFAPANPWRNLARAVRVPAPPPPQIWSRREIATILEGTLTHPKAEIRHWYGFILCLVGSGCRPGELAALRWQFVADGCDRCWIGRAIARGGVEKETKGRTARFVGLSSEAAAWLRSQRQTLRPGPEDFVFRGPRGAIVSDGAFRGAWRVILQDVGLPYRRPYLLRHTFGSHAVGEDGNRIAIAQQMGHSPSVAEKNYWAATEPIKNPNLGLGRD